MIHEFEYPDHTNQAGHKARDWAPIDDIQIIIQDESDYPASLVRWPGRQAPGELYYVGDTGLFREHPLVLVCGAREASQTALDMAGQCAYLCGQADIPVVSGLARGVDRVAHNAVLLAGGRTIAVLPYGIGRLPYDETLAGYIQDQRLLVTSELNPDAHFTAGRALRRNRIMVALADVVIVVEPGETGGTWSSAKAAQEFGRPLYFITGERAECAEKLVSLGGRPLPVKAGGTPDIDTVLASVDKKIA